VIYIHVPFCRSFCTYCDFYSEIASDEDFERYADAVCREIAGRKEEITDEVNTLYIGGGTPSVPPLSVLKKIVSSIGKGPYQEFTIEVNPEDIIVEDKSTNTKENVVFTLKILNLTNEDTVMLITSEFHLKRCKAIIQKQLPGIHTILVKAPDGIHDRDCWFKNDMVWGNNGKNGSGRTLVKNEAVILIEWACNGDLEDIEI
jgi:hypothetical protein